MFCIRRIMFVDAEPVPIKSGGLESAMQGRRQPEGDQEQRSEFGLTGHDGRVY